MTDAEETQQRTIDAVAPGPERTLTVVIFAH
jgi:hypothetical protein